MLKRSCTSCLVLCALLALALAGCGDAAGKTEVVPGHDFADVFSADLAGDPGELAWAIAGQLEPGARHLDVRLYRRGRGGDWTRAPRLAGPMDAGGQPSVAVLGGALCVGYGTAAGRPTLSCLHDGRWRALPQAGLPLAPARLSRLSTSQGRLVAVFSSGAGADALTTVLRLDRARWRVLGRPLRTHGAIVTLGESTDAGGALDLALVDLPRRQRSLLTFRDGAWRRSGSLDGVGGGPMPGGPVRVAGRVYLPVVDASATPWRFSVFVLSAGRWARLGAPLNEGLGNAQGVLSASRGAVWATWQENALRPDGRFDTRVYARQVAPRRGDARMVWQGVTIGPGSVETVHGAGGQSVLYMPSAAGGRRLTARVDSLQR